MSASSNMTPGALRCLDRARRQAADRGSPSAEPEDLLIALFAHETLAGDILDKLGVKAAALADIGLSSEFESTTQSSWPDRDRLEQIIDAAHAVARRSGAEATGSEHLLWSLMNRVPALAARLAENGVTPEAIESHMLHPPIRLGAPLAVECEIRVDGRTEAPTVQVLRILDAAENRAREGLRVIEDYTRFVLDDQYLTRLLKTCRHELAIAAARPESLDRLRSRDTESDVGTTIATATEQSRETVPDVVTANTKRVQEALRTLEEFGKVLSPTMGAQIRQIRYSLYTIEKSLAVAQRSDRVFADRWLHVLLTERNCRSHLEAMIRQVLAGGASIIQLREKQLSDRELLERGKLVRSITRRHDALFIMNDRPDLAVLVDADGVHVGQDECRVSEARRIVGSDRLVGVSTHTIEQARRAVRDGADYLGVGPVFPSDTKQFDSFVGLEFVRQAAADIHLPWFAIGGITIDNLQDVVDAGATRVAVSGAVCRSEEPGSVCRRIVRALEQKRPGPDAGQAVAEITKNTKDTERKEWNDATDKTRIEHG